VTSTRCDLDSTAPISAIADRGGGMQHAVVERYPGGTNMIDPTNSLNVMRALQGPNNQQAQGGQDKSQGGGLPQGVQQIVDAIAKAIGGLLASAAKGGDQGNGMSDGDKQQARNAVAGVQNGRLSQERNQMTG
jgi:hypothetical protein